MSLLVPCWGTQLLVASTLVITLSAVGQGQATNGTVSGTVVRSSKQGPFKGARVHLSTDPAKPPVAETKTDDKGNYSLSAIPGAYQIVVDIKGVEPGCSVTNQFGKATLSGRVGSVTLVSGRTEKYNFDFKCE